MFAAFGGGSDSEEEMKVVKGKKAAQKPKPQTQKDETREVVGK